MTQAAPALPVTGTINIDASSHSQRQGAHGAFRYFGKLAPDVTGAVLDLAAELVEVDGPVVDLMCGSGTTLLEAEARGWRSIGIDVNAIAALFARVKTRAVDRCRYQAALAEVIGGPPASPAEVEATFAVTRNAERWFTAVAMQAVASLRSSIMALPHGPEREALLAALLGRLRRISNGSARTGRLFYDPQSAEPAVDSFEAAADDLLSRLPETNLDCVVEIGDARSTGLPRDSTNLTFCHPPYFALYRYSADVLRFEMEIGGYSRRDTNRREVREGWKSGDVSNLDGYVTDMTAVAREARRVTVDGGVFALIASNSTLGDVQLPVIDRLAERFLIEGWSVQEHLVRTAHFGSAKYHRSARTDKVIQQDHVILFS